jgi:hypothetical protein
VAYSWIGQSTCCGSEQEPFFLGAMALMNSVNDYAKGCRIWLAMSTYMSCVSAFSCMMYIDLNRHDSQI